LLDPLRGPEAGFTRDRRPRRRSPSTKRGPSSSATAASTWSRWSAAPATC